MKRLALVFLSALFYCLSSSGAGLSWMNRCEPRNLGTLQGWWKQDSITNANNTVVTNWPDSTGGTHAGVQTTAAFEPKFFTGIFGSSGGVRFANDNNLVTQNFLDTSSGLSANSITTSGDFTFLCVHVSNATGAGFTQQSVLAGNAYASGTGVLSVSDNAGNILAIIDEGPTHNDTSANIGIGPGNPIAGVWVNKGGTVSFYANKSNVTSGTPSYGTFKFNFIAASAAATINRFNGDIAEMAILFNTVTDSQVFSIYGSYWRPKYSTLP